MYKAGSFELNLPHGLPASAGARQAAPIMVYMMNQLKTYLHGVGKLQY
jgi:hypothetical protein